VKGTGSRQRLDKNQPEKSDCGYGGIKENIMDCTCLMILLDSENHMDKHDIAVRTH